MAFYFIFLLGFTMFAWFILLMVARITELVTDAILTSFKR